MRWALILNLIFLTPSVWARWSFSALRGQKLHFQGKALAGKPVMVLADNKCLELRGEPVAEDLDFEAYSVPSANSEELAAWTKDPCVRAIADNPRFFINALDARFNEQAALPAIAHSKGSRLFFHPLFGIRLPVTIAIVDTGIQLSHPDLSSRLWRGSRGEYGYDFANSDDDPSDDNGHGTHVAGIAGAQSQNGIGVRGVMGEWSRLMAIKTQASDGGGFLSSLVNGIRWAADHGADVINVSIDGRDKNPVLEDAIQYAIAKGATVVVAAGNEGQEISSSHFVTPIGYAAGNLGLIGVGAFDALDFTRPLFSNYSRTYVEISAPGAVGREGILSTFFRSDYLSMRGTSMAAPHVAGAAALSIGFAKTQGQSLTPADVENLILESAVADANLANQFAGGRRLDLDNLGRRLMRAWVVDADGGFDAP